MRPFALVLCLFPRSPFLLGLMSPICACLWCTGDLLVRNDAACVDSTVQAAALIVATQLVFCGFLARAANWGFVIAGLTDTSKYVSVHHLLLPFSL